MIVFINVMFKEGESHYLSFLTRKMTYFVLCISASVKGKQKVFHRITLVARENLTILKLLEHNNIAILSGQ